MRAPSPANWLIANIDIPTRRGECRSNGMTKFCGDGKLNSGETRGLTGQSARVKAAILTLGSRS
jgi:hypothetical protein